MEKTIGNIAIIFGKVVEFQNFAYNGNGLIVGEVTLPDKFIYVRWVSHKEALLCQRDLL